jgi:hypothetical protein
MQIISVDRAAAYSSAIDHWNDGMLENVLTIGKCPIIPLFQFSNLRHFGF